jgi:transposase
VDVSRRIGTLPREASGLVEDKVFIVDESLGDVVLTQSFKRYSESESFDCVFCRKADPQTKGKVENVVKYVKYNFLRGRHF